MAFHQDSLWQDASVERGGVGLSGVVLVGQAIGNRVQPLGGGGHCFSQFVAEPGTLVVVDHGEPVIGVVQVARAAPLPAAPPYGQ